MNITVNGRERDVEDGLSIAALLDGLGIARRRLAVEVNEHVVPASEHARTALSEGDRVEIIHAIGGG